MSRFWLYMFLGAALSIPAAYSPMPLRADDEHDRRTEKDQRYRDAKHNDEHEWNSREDRAYREWVKENHRKYQDFNRINERDQEQYWNWRHDHPDRDDDREHRH